MTDEHEQDPEEWRVHDSAFPDLTIQTGEDQMDEKIELIIDTYLLRAKSAASDYIKDKSTEEMAKECWGAIKRELQIGNSGCKKMEKKKLWQFLFWLCLCLFAGASLALIRRLLS